MEMEKDIQNHMINLIHNNNSSRSDTKNIKDTENGNSDSKSDDKSTNENEDSDKDKNDNDDRKDVLYNSKLQVQQLTASLESRKTERLIQRGIDVWNNAFERYIREYNSDSKDDNNKTDDNSYNNNENNRDDLYLPEGIIVSDQLGDEALRKWMNQNF